MCPRRSSVSFLSSFAATFYGYANCDAYLSEYARGACGCFLGGYPGAFVDVPTSLPLSTRLSSSLNFNQVRLF